METKDFLVLESVNENDPVRCCAFVPSFAAKVGDLANTENNGLCRVVYPFYDPREDIVSALTDAYGSDTVKAVYSKGWEAAADA